MHLSNLHYALSLCIVIKSLWMLPGNVIVLSDFMVSRAFNDIFYESSKKKKIKEYECFWHIFYNPKWTWIYEQFWNFVLLFVIIARVIDTIIYSSMNDLSYVFDNFYVTSIWPLVTSIELYVPRKKSASKAR